MPTYVSLLRGINVSGRKRIRMERLRALYESLGFEEISTYLQSGNVVFRAPRSGATALAARIAGRIEWCSVSPSPF